MKLKCQNPECGGEFEYPAKKKGRPKKYCPICHPIMTKKRVSEWKKGIKSERGSKKNRYGIKTPCDLEGNNWNARYL